MNTMEAFMFASINEKNGSLLYSRTILTYGLAGIALVELMHMGRISFDGKLITAGTASLTGDELLDQILGILSKKTSACKTYTLVSNVSSKVNRFSKRLMERLEDNGYIRIEQTRFLGLIPYDRYIISRDKEHGTLVRELKDIVHKGDKRLEPEKALLITILNASGVLRKLFDKEERKQVRNTMKLIGKAEFFETLDDFAYDVHKAVKALIAAAHAAAT